MKQSVKKIFSIYFVSIIFILVFSIIVWYFQRHRSLFDLQRKITIADSPNDRKKILSQLDKYYLAMSIPDSIRQHVESEVKRLIENQDGNNLQSFDGNDADTNVFRMENSLRRVLRQAMIARVKGEESIFDKLTQRAKILAVCIDERNKFDYWQDWIHTIKNFTAEKSFQWLSAEQAEYLCKANHLSNYNDGEKFGALGLKYLQQCQDKRLGLDITQRLMLILYQSRGLYDLSYYYGQRAYQDACKLKYSLRAVGILYNCAEALHKSGKNNSALIVFRKIVENTTKHDKIPGMDWYHRYGLIGIARTNWQLGNYRETLSLCSEIEKLNLDITEKILLHITKGISHRSIGNYDIARDEYNKALDIAQKIGDYANQIEILRNIGLLYHRLTEYDKATYYFYKALNINQLHFGSNNARKGEILICLAETKAAQHETEESDYLINEVTDLIKQIDFPILRAVLLRSLGRLNMNLQRSDQAYFYLQQSYAQFEECGLFRAALETKNNLAQCLISLSKLREAKDLLNDVLNTSKKINDSQREIDAIAMMAEIAQLEGQIDKAIYYSNQIIKETEEVSNRFNDIDNLTIFRQKINEYLRKAVVYELEKGRLDSAFVKLDYFKARALKNKFEIEKNNNSLNDLKTNFFFVDLEYLKTKLGNNQLLINYFATKDTLFAFVLDHRSLKLLKKSIKSDHLKNLVDDYLISINKTIDVFQNQQLVTYSNHYDTTISLSQQLYQYLLNWNELQTILANSKITYIISDDILFNLPFSSLTCSNTPSPKFFIQQTAISYLPSAICLQTIHKEKINHDIFNKKVLVSANRKLPGAEDLLGFVKKQFSNVEELSIDKQIVNKEEILLKLNQKYDVYIFFGHSKANTIFPDSSYFELAAFEKEHSRVSNVRFYISDLKKIDWSHADMILLLGCETGRGKPYKGTGLAGIQQAVLASGGEAVLATLWEVDANHVLKQIKYFLTYWQETKNPTIALQNANLKYIENLQRNKIYQKPHPYIWGSFSLLHTIII